MDRRVPLAVGIDVFSVTLFVAVGRREHERDSAIAGLIDTAAPLSASEASRPTTPSNWATTSPPCIFAVRTETECRPGLSSHQVFTFSSASASVENGVTRIEPVTPKAPETYPTCARSSGICTPDATGSVKPGTGVNYAATAGWLATRRATVGDNCAPTPCQ